MEKQKKLFNSDFDGSDYKREIDHSRLKGQALNIFKLMKDSSWRTLDEIHNKTSHPHASISAQLRHLRKKRFGAHTINKRYRSEPELGLYEYQLVVNE